MLILKAFSLETDLWVAVGDFTEKRKIWKENLYLIEYRLGTNKSVRKIMTVICVTYVQKDFQIRALIKQLLTKYQFFM